MRWRIWRRGEEVEEEEEDETEVGVVKEEEKS